MMKVFATRLGTVLSITFVDDGGGWQFGSWTTITDRAPAVQPQADDRSKRFVDVTEALAYFRARYGDVAGAATQSRASI